MTDTQKDSPAGLSALAADVPPYSGEPPFDDATRQKLVEAESRRHLLNQSTAISLAIGVTMHTLGETVITLSPQAIQAFCEKHTVVMETIDDGVQYKIVKREGKS